jgi:hypothetical protein
MQITLSVARSKREFYDYDNPRSFAPGPRTREASFITLCQ